MPDAIKVKLIRPKPKQGGADDGKRQTKVVEMKAGSRLPTGASEVSSETPIDASWTDVVTEGGS